MSDTSRKLPQPKPIPILGNLLNLDLQSPIQSMMELAKTYGPIFRLQVPTEDLVVISSRELGHEVCDETRFDKKVHGPLDVVRDYAGDGLITAHTREPNWSKAHRILLPAFGPSSLKPMFAQMYDVADQMLLKWERQGPDFAIDVSDNMTRLTVDTIALCAFSYRLNSFYDREMHPFVDAMMRSLIESSARTRRPPFQTEFLFGKKKQYALDQELMHKLADDIIAARKKGQAPVGGRDILETMLTASDPETGEQLDETNIRYQMVTFLIAGHETTSGLLSFSIYELLRHPDALAKARAQVDEVLGGRKPTYEDLSDLTYIDQILKESLRLWPTVPAFAVFSKEPETLLAGRYPVTSKQTILLLLPTLQRDPTVWERPDEFYPEQMERSRFNTLPPDSWKPFGNGQRSCIGRAFALQEAALALTMILQRFELTAVHTTAELKIKESLTLKPDRFMIYARPRPQMSPQAAQVDRPMQRSARSRGPLQIYFGSKTGTAESFAEDLALEAKTRGFTPVVSTLDEGFSLVAKESPVVIFSASYDGQPPDNARMFLKGLARAEAGRYEGLNYVVFGCGNRDWSRTYQSVPKFIDRKLEMLGATRFFDRGEADARDDSRRDFENWSPGFWEALDRLHPQLEVAPAFERVLKRFGLEDATGLFHPSHDFSQPATAAEIHRLLEFTECPPDKIKLQSFLEGRVSKSLIDILESVPSCTIPLKEFVRLFQAAPGGEESVRV